MEIVVIVVIWSVIVKRGVEDLIHTARGGTPHRYTAARARRSNGAAGRYWGALWDDVWTDMHKRHVAKRADPDRPRGAATVFWSNLWRDGWAAAERRRQRRTIRPRPGQQTVPGVVVPNQDGTQDRPEGDGQDESRPEPRIVQDEDGTTDQDELIVPPDPSQLDCRNCIGRHWHDQYCMVRDDDPWIGTASQDDEDMCPKCGTPMNQTPILANPGSWTGSLIRRCPNCDHHTQEPREMTDDEYKRINYLEQFRSNTTQEGPTTMTATTTEVTGLSQTIRFCEDSASAFRAQAQATEQTVAAIAAGDVSGPAAAKLAHAMELSMAAAEAMDEAAAEFRPHLAIQEQYNANPGAGTREFVTAGQ